MEPKHNSEDLLYNGLLEKARRYSAYRDRCRKEVVDKLKNLGASAKLISKITDQLIKEKFLDEERFCRSFVNGKLSVNNWGRHRIMMELRLRQIPEDIISSALEEISFSDYEKILEKQVLKKSAAVRETHQDIRRGKIAAYCINKGFEPELVWKTVKENI